MKEFQPSKAAINATKVLRQDYQIVLIDSVPRPGRFDNYSLNILNPTGRQGAEIRLASLKFSDRATQKNLDVNLYFNAQNGDFMVRCATGRTFTDNLGHEAIIMDSDFFNKKSRNRKVEKNEHNEDVSVYVFNRTGETLTDDQYRELPIKPNDIIETYARAFICEVFRDYLYHCSYRVDSTKIKDVRPSTDRDGKEIYVERFSTEELVNISQNVNDFIVGKRGIHGERKIATETAVTEETTVKATIL